MRFYRPPRCNSPGGNLSLGLFDRVRVVLTRPGLGAVGVVDDGNDGTVSTGAGEEDGKAEKECVPAEHHDVAATVDVELPVVVVPHDCVRHHTYSFFVSFELELHLRIVLSDLRNAREGSERLLMTDFEDSFELTGTDDSANERNEVAEDGNGRADDVGDKNGAGDAREPSDPVDLGGRRKVASASEDADEEVLGSKLYVSATEPSAIHAQTYVRVDAKSDEESGDGESVGNLLHEGTSGAEGGVGDVLAAVVVDDDADDGVDDVEDAHREAHGLLVGAGVTHLGDNAKVGGGGGEGEDNRVDSAHGGGKGRVVGDPEVLGPGAGGVLLGGKVGALLDTDGDSESEDSGHDGNEADPAEPRNLAEGTDRGKTPTSDGGDGDEDGRARAVVGSGRRDGVESSANGKNAGSRDEDHEKNKGDAKVLAAKATSDDEAGVGNGVHLGVVHLKVSNNSGAVCGRVRNRTYSDAWWRGT